MAAKKKPSTPSPETFEKLGTFYLGGLHEPGKGTDRAQPLLYDAKDLTTHAVCLGMTGSGKTGLGVCLLEEAAIDGVPAIVIDPKGDMGNLLLSFPDLAPGDFEPWIDPDEAARKGNTLQEHAAAKAKLWRDGLASWGEGPERIRRLKEAADIVLYTPGSNAGEPLSLLKSFAAPPPALLEDGELLRERIQSAVSGLLALLDIDAPPLQSREHILLSTILAAAWNDGRDLELADLIRDIQQPPFERLGVMDLETVYPAKDRFGLAMALNNLIASPGFSAWMAGAALDPAKLYRTPAGRPRIAIVSIAHLSDAERMFFVTLLLNEVLAWVRTQPGTTSLRALVYMDEVFGYLPPSAEPPSKRPLLTLLKQARAYGLGVVLATQNPVDLDYKALSNAGTWFLGRLQTERDKLRVLDGLEGVAAAQGGGFDRQRIEEILSGLASRVFLMNNVHEDAPVLFETRWALSFLRGPLTRSEIQRLTTERPKLEEAAPAEAGEAPARHHRPAAKARQDSRPVLPPGVPEAFWDEGTPAGEEPVYQPNLFGEAELHYVNARAGIDHWRDVAYLAPLDEDQRGDPWDQAEAVEAEEVTLAEEPFDGAGFAPLPAKATRAKSYPTWQRGLKTQLYQQEALALARCKILKLIAAPEESEAAFRVRLAERAREERDLQLEKLRKRYAPKLARLQEQIRRAEERVQREESQYEGQKMQAAISLGATVLGALFGRKLGVGTVRRGATSLRGAGRAFKERQDIQQAARRVAELEQKLALLSTDLESEMDAVRLRFDPDFLELDELTVKPRKSDITVKSLTLLWAL